MESRITCVFRLLYMSNDNDKSGSLLVLARSHVRWTIVVSTLAVSLTCDVCAQARLFLFLHRALTIHFCVSFFHSLVSFTLFA